MLCRDAGGLQLSTIQRFVDIPMLERFDGFLGAIDLHLDVL